ncbi:MAG: F0F1 ATP synthase subunit epsilon [Actinomycetales bacterium]|nr:F0F1 ATP synthase subunit epsilon [Actinomycetales bacterium]
MNVRVVTTDEVLWVGKARSVVVPSADGDLGILPGRQPILAVLRQGKGRVTAEDGQVFTFPIVAGFVSCDNDEIEVVLDNTGEGYGD